MTNLFNFARIRAVKLLNSLIALLSSNKLINSSFLMWKSAKYKPNLKEINEIYNLIDSLQQGVKSNEIEISHFIDLIDKNVVQKANSREIASLLYGALVYRAKGITPSLSHSSFVSLYEKTNGLFQDVLHSALFYRHQPTEFKIPLSSSSFFEGNLTNQSLHSVISSVHSDGYARLNFQLTDAVLQQIQAEALRMRYRLGRKVQEVSFVNPSSPPDCNIAYVDPQDLNSSSLIRELVEHPLLLQLASKCLSVNAKLLNNVMWYSFPSVSASSEAAQFFHYDLDTFRWLKLFIYLSDVDSFAGPHEYVGKTHRAGSKNPNLLLRGYSRISDCDIDLYQIGKRKLLTGCKGSMFLADTRCFHKGNLPVSNYRLVLQPIYGASDFSYLVE